MLKLRLDVLSMLTALRCSSSAFAAMAASCAAASSSSTSSSASPLADPSGAAPGALPSALSVALPVSAAADFDLSLLAVFCFLTAFANSEMRRARCCCLSRSASRVLRIASTSSLILAIAESTTATR